MTVGYEITEEGLNNLGVNPRLTKWSSKDGITLEDVLKVLDPGDLKRGVSMLPLSVKNIANKLDSKTSRVENLLERLTKMGLVRKVGANQRFEDAL